MRISDDAKQLARIALWLRGAEVEDPAAWLHTTERNIQINLDFREARELHEMAASVGDFASPAYTRYLEMVEARRARVRAWYAAHPKGAAYRRQLEHRKTPAGRARRAAYMRGYRARRGQKA